MKVRGTSTTIDPAYKAYALCTFEMLCNFGVRQFTRLAMCFTT